MSSRTLQALVVAAGFLLGGVLATWPMATDPAHLALASPANNDYWFNTWVVFWGAHALTTDPLALHDANIFWPETSTFAYSDMELAHSLLVLPVILAGGSPILTMNVLLLLSITIGGTGAFVLGRRVTGSSLAGLVVAAVFVFNAAHFARYLAPQFFGDHWLPWLAWAVLRWLDRPRPGRALLAGAFLVLHALTGSHNAVFGALLVAVLVLVHMARSGEWTRRERLVGLAVMALLSLLVLAPLFYPYLLLQERMATERGGDPEVLRAGAAGPRDLLTGASRLHLWIDRELGWPSALFTARLQAHLFPGWVPLLLAGLLLLPGRRTARGPRDRAPPRPGSPLVWAVFLGVCLLLALGPAAGLYRLVAALPGLQLIRIPSRFLLPGLLGLSVLAGFGALRLRRWLPRPAATWATIALVALFAAESALAPLPTIPMQPGPDPVAAWLADRSGDFAVLEVPVEPDNFTVHVRQMRQSLFHWKRLLVGYSGWRSREVQRRLRRIDRRFPGPAILDELAELDVRYVVILEDRVPDSLLREVREQRRLRLATRLDGTSIWELAPADGSDGA